MADIKEHEKVYLENLFEMNGGYVLDFSNSKFQSFILENFKIDIKSDKYSTFGSSMPKRLKEFWRLEDNKTVGKSILELIKTWKAIQRVKGETKIVEKANTLNECIKIANRLLGIKNETPKSEETIKDFLNKKFEIISLEKLKIDSSLIDILNSRINEIQRVIKIEAALSCIFLCGSVLEGILLGIASSKPKEFNQCEISPKNNEEKVLPFQMWTLSNFIDVSHKLGLLGLDVKKYSHNLRDFRNYIHPYQQMSSQFNPDIDTAKISWQVLKAAITDLSKKI